MWRKFQVLIGENDATWSRRGKSLNLGRLTSQAYFKKTQASKLGDAQGIPLFIYNYQVHSNDAIFLLFHASIFFLGASVCFVLFCLLLYLLDPSILVWERDTLHLFYLEYSCASLIPVEYSCLAAVFAVSSKFLYVSCVEISVLFWKKYSLASLIFVWRVD